MAKVKVNLKRHIVLESGKLIFAGEDFVSEEVAAELRGKSGVRFPDEADTPAPAKAKGGTPQVGAAVAPQGAQTGGTN